MGLRYSDCKGCDWHIRNKKTMNISHCTNPKNIDCGSDSIWVGFVKSCDLITDEGFKIEGNGQVSLI